MFKILSIRTLEKPVLPETDSYKFNHEKARYVSVMRVLKPETEYKLLSGTLPDDFYSKDKNINICAIVGENGMGKSTLIQLMIRILNNVAYALKDAFDDDLHPRFVRSIYAELEYSIDETIHCIKCKDDTVSFFKSGDMVWEYKYSEIPNENKGMRFQSDVCQKAYAKNSANCAKTWLNEFFYTVTVDYSAYGLNYNDYFSELTDYNELDESEKGNVSQEETFWAYSIFHKNDEYQLPIVLNPYRSEGIIDYNNEIELTKSRVFMLALHHNNALNTIFDDKEVHSIRFDIRTDLNARPFVYYESFKVRYEMQRLGVVEYWRTAKIDEYKQLCDAIIKKWGNLYGFDIFEKLADRDQNDFIRAINYIVYKTINIAHTYKRYEKYLEVLRSQATNTDRQKEFEEYIDKLYNNQTHITLKLRKTFAWLVYNHYGTEMKAEEGVWSHSMLFSVFLNRIDDILKEEKVKLEKENVLLSTEEINKKLRKKEEELYPAPCFYSDIILTNKDTKSNNRIAFSSLSSGEKQIVNFLSTVIYQFYNISSRWEDKEDDIKAIKYKYINLIMDEIELYCHPKFQMFLIDKLINTIEVILSTQYIKGVNVILSTHSPFILSDIPKQNILGLKNGVPDGLERSDNTFCSNIYDILNDGFFLDMFVGDFAKKKTKAAITKLDKWKEKRKENDGEAIEIDPEELNEVRNTIAIIGDRYLKAKMEEKLMRVIVSDNRMSEYRQKRKELEDFKKNLLYDSDKI